LEGSRLPRTRARRLRASSRRATSTLAHDPKLYDRTGDELRLDGVERIRI
jgi:hypothetical protein